MRQSLLHVALVVRDYDEAVRSFCDKLHVTLVEDTYQPDHFVREPNAEPYGTAAVFEDLYGNLWDLIQPRDSRETG